MLFISHISLKVAKAKPLSYHNCVKCDSRKIWLDTTVLDCTACVTKCTQDKRFVPLIFRRIRRQMKENVLNKLQRLHKVTLLSSLFNLYVDTKGQNDFNLFSATYILSN